MKESLVSFLERNAMPNASKGDPVKQAGEAMRAKIEEVFDRQVKVSARLKAVLPTRRPKTR